MAKKKLKQKMNNLKKEIKREEQVLLPFVMAIIVVGALYMIIFSVDPTTEKTGLATEITNEEVFCLRQEADNSNSAVYSKESCCFLIANTDRCRAATEDEQSAHYRDATGDYKGYLEYDYACFGGSAKRVFFNDDTRYFCGLEIN